MTARLLLWRLVALVGVLLAVSALVFLLGALIPGDLTSVVVGQEGATDAQFAEVRKRLGLDQPLHVQYARWLAGAATGDFGVSPITGRKVAADLATQIPVSLELTGLTLLFSTVLGMPAGIVAAVHANRRLDVVIRAFLLVMFSIPVFVVGVLLLLLVSQTAPEAFQVAYTPWSEDPARHLLGLALPLATITLPIAAQTMQITRSAMLEVLGEDYVRTARAKGLSPFRVNGVHALRNALIPVVTVIGLSVGTLLAGAILTETIFSWPGVGKWMVDSIFRRDYQAVQGGLLLIAVIVMFVNLSVDLLYGLINPRIRKG